MKRLPTFALLALLSLFIIPAATAMPGDCWDTCTVDVPCNQATEPCVECLVEYDTDECIQWRGTTCQQVGACGQCAVLQEWTQNGLGSWNYNKSVCYTVPNPDVSHDLYLRGHYRVTYQRQRCNGVETIVEVRRVLDYWEGCTKRTSRACDPRYEKTNISSGPNCSF